MEAIVQVLMSLAPAAAMFGAALSGARGRAWPGGCLIALSGFLAGSRLAGAPAAAMFGAALSGVRGRAWPGGCLIALSGFLAGSRLAGAPVVGALTASLAVVVLSGAVVWGVGFFGLRGCSHAVTGGRS